MEVEFKDIMNKSQEIEDMLCFCDFENQELNKKLLENNFEFENEMVEFQRDLRKFMIKMKEFDVLLIVKESENQVFENKINEFNKQKIEFEDRIFQLDNQFVDVEIVRF